MDIAPGIILIFVLVILHHFIFDAFPFISKGSLPLGSLLYQLQGFCFIRIRHIVFRIINVFQYIRITVTTYRHHLHHGMLK